MGPDAAALQAQLDQFRAYFRDHAGQMELLAESADTLLRMMATYVLMDLTLERHVLTLSDRQFEEMLGHSPSEEADATRTVRALPTPTSSCSEPTGP